MIVTGLEPATSRFVVLRSTIDLHNQPIHLQIDLIATLLFNQIQNQRSLLSC